MSNPEGGIPPIHQPDNPRPDPGSSQRQNTVADQWNNLLKDERVQQAKQVSKQYFSFFLTALIRPYRTMRAVGPVQSLNALITMVLVALFSSFYFLTWFVKWDISPAFGPGFLKPLLLTAIGIAAAFILSYGVLRLEKISFDFRLLVARFGTLLVPSVALLALAVLFSIASMFTFAAYLVTMALIVVVIAINVLLFQYPLHTSPGPVDTFFSIFIANAVTIYIFYKLLTSVITGAIGGLFNSFTPFGL